MASGYIPSLDGNSLYLYASGQPFTHGGDASNQTWGSNVGIGILTLRKDGFVSIDSPYKFYGDYPNRYPSFTTVPIKIPSRENLSCEQGTKVSLAVNFLSSVVGFIQLEVLHSWFGDIFPLEGNFDFNPNTDPSLATRSLLTYPHKPGSLVLTLTL